jgi:outer membrane biosynthesis protein TonB
MLSSLKGLSAGLTVSLAVHAALFVTLGIPGGEGDLREPIPILIDEVHFEKAAPEIKAPEPMVKAPAAKKPLKGIPVPRYESQQPKPITGTSEFQNELNKKIKKQIRELQKLQEMEEPQGTAAPKVQSSMTSAELLNDPQKGRIFMGYFSQVKKKIQSTVYQKAAGVYGRGNVCLAFVLDARGRLERVSVVEKGTHADDSMRDMAKRCLQESAPFGDFPKDLGPGRIAFNITIFFDSAE